MTLPKGILLKLLLISIGLLAVIWAGDKVWGHFQHKKDQQFDADQQKSQAQQDQYKSQIDQLQKSWDDAVQQAKAAETRADSLEAQRIIDQHKILAAQARAAGFQTEYQQEAKRYADALANSNVANLDPCTLWVRNCTKAKELGIKPSSEPCDCTGK